MIRPVRIADAEAINGIYNEYIIRTNITFEEEPVTAAIMEERIKTITARYPWLVLEEGGEIAGYAYASQWRERSAYRYTAQDSIYLKMGLEGKGMGTTLLRALLEELRSSANGRVAPHAVISAITIPNDRSVALHEKFGFVKKGCLHEVGYKFGGWIDVGYWELLTNG